MTILDVMEYQGLSRAELIDMSGIPESTLRDILNGEANLSRCQSRTICKLAKALNISVEAVLQLEPVACAAPAPHQPPIHAMIGYASYVLHRQELLRLLKTRGSEDFMRVVLRERLVEGFYADRQFHVALLLIGLMDYLCDSRHLARITRYDRYRGDMMQTLVYPTIKPFYVPSKAQEEYWHKHAIPQLLKFNICETVKTLNMF